jgi:hypothetical protein
MRLWLAIVYTVVYAFISIVGAALTNKAIRTIRIAGDATRPPVDRMRRGTALQEFLLWCLLSMPIWIFGCSAAVWLSWAFGNPAGYGIGLIPVLLLLLAGLAWHCVHHEASPEVRLGTDIPRPKMVIAAL